MIPTPDELVVRLRRWSELSAAPLVMPEQGPPTPEQVAERLREACALWALCVELGALHPVAR